MASRIGAALLIATPLALTSGGCGQGGEGSFERTDAGMAVALPQAVYDGPDAPARPTVPCVVTRLADGDSIECRGLGRIRLLGIDAPELNQPPYGRMAEGALARLIPSGTAVEIELDVEERDRYDRLLAYVWHEGELINWRMVRDGWAVVLTYPPNVQHAESLVAAQERARAEALGLWAIGGFECLPVDRRQGRCR